MYNIQHKYQNPLIDYVVLATKSLFYTSDADDGCSPFHPPTALKFRSVQVFLQ